MSVHPSLEGLSYLIKRNPRGKTYYYVRVGPTEAVHRVEGDPGTPQFMTNYRKALKEALKKRAHTEVKSFNKHKVGWLAEEYKASAAFAELSKWTKRNKLHSLKIITEEFGAFKYCELEKHHVTEHMETLRNTPSMANRFMYDLRALINWSIDQGYVKENITTFIKALPYRTQPHKAWTENEMERFAREFDYDTQERLAFELLSNLGARTGDIIRLGAHNLRGDTLVYVSEKTKIEVTVTVSEDLKQAIQSRQYAGKTFIVQPIKKQPFPTYKHFSDWFQKRARRLGIRKPIHGIRKTVACRQLEAGANIPQAMATQGWKSPQTLLAYARDMDRQKIGVQASPFLVRSKTRDTQP